MPSWFSATAVLYSAPTQYPTVDCHVRAIDRVRGSAPDLETLARKGKLRCTFPPKRQMTEEKITMKAIVVTDQAAGRAGMKLVERPEPQRARLASLSGANYGDVVVQVHASEIGRAHV